MTEAAGEEASDEEDEPTLSLSNPDLRPVETADDSCCHELPHADSEAAIAAAAGAWRKRSTSESDRDQEADTRISRSAKRSVHGRQQQKGYESTQSVDRFEKERSPVFFLDPEDWFRSEGSVPTVDLSVSKLLESSPLAAAATTTIVRSESDEKLDAELERISFLSEALRRSHNEIHSRSESETPNFIRSRSTTPGAGGGWRSATPVSRGGWRPIREEPICCDRNRKVAIPILCQRGALRVGPSGLLKLPGKKLFRVTIKTVVFLPKTRTLVYIKIQEYYKTYNNLASPLLQKLKC